MHEIYGICLCWKRVRRNRLPNMKSAWHVCWLQCLSKLQVIAGGCLIVFAGLEKDWLTASLPSLEVQPLDARWPGGTLFRSKWLHNPTLQAETSEWRSRLSCSFLWSRSLHLWPCPHTCTFAGLLAKESITVLSVHVPPGKRCLMLWGCCSPSLCPEGHKWVEMCVHAPQYAPSATAALCLRAAMESVGVKDISSAPGRVREWFVFLLALTMASWAGTVRKRKQESKAAGKMGGLVPGEQGQSHCWWSGPCCSLTTRDLVGETNVNEMCYFFAWNVVRYCTIVI